MFNRKFYAKALAFAMVMATVGINGIVVAPIGIVEAKEGKNAPTITFDPNTYEATIALNVADTKSGYVCLQVLKDEKGEKVSSEVWYAVDTAKKAVVDLSFLKATKVQYIRAVSMDGDPSAKVTVIAAQPKTVIKYDAKTQKFVDKSKAPIGETDLAKYEYKTLYGSNWGTIATGGNNFTASTLAAFKTNKLENAVVAGTTLVVRKAASKTAGSEAPAGTEVKVKIPAVAKAPKVKVDYVKGAITLAKNTEIVLVDANNGKLVTKTGGTNVAWEKAEGKLSPDKLLEKLGVASAKVKETTMSGYTFAVRSAEVTNKKPASNIAFITINPALVIKKDAETITTPSASTNKIKIQTDETQSKDQIICTMLADGEGMKLTPETGVTGYAYSTDGKKWISITSEVTVKLEDKETIKVYVPAVKGDDKTPASFASNIVEVQYQSYKTQTAGS